MSSVVVDNEEASRTSGNVLQALHEFRESSMPSLSDRLLRKRWQVLLFGQIVALSVASTNSSSFMLQYKFGVKLRLFQMTFMYMILSLHLCCRNIDHRQREPSGDEASLELHRVPLLGIRLRIPWWIYLGITILDVEANFMTILSFRFTSLTSATLLGSLTVPAVMAFSRILLAREFSMPHYVGVCLCLVGGTMMVWSDIGNTNGTSSSNHSYIGDILAISAAVLYGLWDAVAEFAIKHVDRVEYLGMIGLFGCVISGVQCLIVERGALSELSWSLPVASIMACYATSLVFFYVSASFFLISSEATMLTLSLQTTSLWACLFSVVAVGAMPPLQFYVAVVLVASGVCVYEFADRMSLQKSNAVPLSIDDDSDDHNESQKFSSVSSDESKKLHQADAQRADYMSITT